MDKKEYKSMEYKGLELLATIPINGTYILGIYKGKISKYDILIKYRQLENGKWSRQRTPKHIHWAVDMLIKHYKEPKETDKLLEHLIKVWDESKPIKSENERTQFLDVNSLTEAVNKEASNYKKLANKGEYSVKFLLLIAKLLIVQEKTNREDAYMFKNLLVQLKKHRNIFEIISTATFH